MNSRRLLQCAVVLACLVPLLAGGAGMALGAAAFGDAGAGRDMDSHVRYLSGLLFAIGLAFLATVPQIERQGSRFRLLTVLVAVGGLARLAGLAAAGVPGPPMLGGLVMELLVTPALCFWQSRVARA